MGTKDSVEGFGSCVLGRWGVDKLVDKVLVRKGTVVGDTFVVSVHSSVLEDWNKEVLGWTLSVVDVLGETWSTSIVCEFLVSVVRAAVGTAVFVNMEAVWRFEGRCLVGTKAVDLGFGVVSSLDDVFLVSTGIVSVVGEDVMVIIVLLYIVGAIGWELFGVVAKFTM